MRFLENGADIPDDLVRSVSDGHAVFLCGAGVSRQAGMPTFAELTEYIYAELGETRDNEPAERIAFAREEFDRVLRSLEKRTFQSGFQSRVRLATTKRLTAKPGIETRYHLTLLQLSRDVDGRPRLLTTNFDTLFERAAQAGLIGDAPSHAGKSIPKPGGPDDYGILHLHGRIGDTELSLTPSDLILTSADFGDAYLRDGWASQYIEDRMRLNTLVLIGYAADDAAFRLLLETLDADRVRFRDLKNIYAISKRHDDSASVWKAKGINPIEFADYNVLYNTLAEWAHYCQRPIEYGRDRICSILVGTSASEQATASGASDAKKKTPQDASGFEREQLRFFLTRDDLCSTLTKFNPSIAWLPWLYEMNLLEPRMQIAPWIEKNFNELNTIRDTVANIHFFDTDTADFLDFRLEQQLDSLSPLQIKCWRLIIRFMRSARRKALLHEWFDLAPRIKRGEQSYELLERVSDALRPKLKISRRIAWPEDGNQNVSERPTDLMSIMYDIEEGLNEQEVLSVWPKNTSADVDAKLLRILTSALTAALADATDVGVEGDQGYSASDFDVPSVAKHHQNEYRDGFLTIVRVIAEVWTQLSAKDSALALNFVDQWQHSEFRLIRRIGLFAGANPIVPTDIVAEMLRMLPRGELFLTSSSVEIHRLLRERWPHFTSPQRENIENRIIEGPPTDWFRKQTNIEELVARCHFNLLGDLQRNNLEITNKSRKLLQEIAERWPNWKLRPPEQAGFHSWHESRSGFVGDPDKLKDVNDDHLVEAAEKLAANAGIFDGDAWRAICQVDPMRALRGLEAQAAKGRWSAQAWNCFLQNPQKIDEPERINLIAQLLMNAPNGSFLEIASSAAWWLNENTKMLKETSLWPLWDRIFDSVSCSVVSQKNA